MKTNNILELTDNNFHELVIQEKKPFLVDFWAEWCSPCKTLSPILDEISLSENYKDKILFGKLNVDNNEKTPNEYNVRGIPTLIIFNNGNIVSTKVGALKKMQLETFLNDTLKKIIK